MERVDNLRTPCVLLDLKKLKENAGKMSDYATEEGLLLVPHMKTHKTIEIGEMMTDESKENRHIVVASLSQADFFANSEKPKFDEITYAYPLTPDKIAQCSAIASAVKQFNLMIDNSFILQCLSANPPQNGKSWNVYVDIDLLYQRSGLLAHKYETFEFIKSVAATSNISFLGLYMHCGSTYNSRSIQETKEMVSKSVAALNGLSTRLKEAGVPCNRVAIGSTPSCSLFEKGIFRGLTEIHPGNYIFYDAQQKCLKSCEEEDIAITVLTRVIAVYPERNMLLIDCGWEGLSSEKPGDEEYLNKYGYAMFRNFPNLKLLSMSQELGKVTTNDDSPLDYSKFHIGFQFQIYPWHSCATAAMHGKYLVWDGSNPDVISDVYYPCRGW